MDDLQIKIRLKLSFQILSKKSFSKSYEPGRTSDSNKLEHRNKKQ